MISHYLFGLALWQLVQVSVAIAIVGLATSLFCRRRPELAYALWILVLLKCLTPPIWNSPIGIFSWAASHQALLPAPSHTHPILSIAPALVAAPLSAASHAISISPGWQPWQMALLIWACGCAAIVLAIAIRARMLARKITRLAEPPPQRLTDALDVACQSLGLRRRPALRLCRAPIGPAIFGTFRPILVIPVSVLRDSTMARLRIIIMHELIHLRRRDPLVAAAQLLVQTVWWFHPLVWWMNRQITQTRELCCDSQAVASLRCPPAEYAQVLIDMLRLRRAFLPIPLSVGIRSAQVTARRLDHIMSATHISPRRISWRIWIALAACGLSLLPGAGCVSKADTTTAPTPQPSQSDMQSNPQANKALFDFLGQPVPPPVGLNPMYTKEGLTAAMRQAAGVANIPLKKIEVDDSEFPYLIGAVMEKGQMDKLDASIKKLAGFEYQGSDSSDTIQVMNLIPYGAWPHRDNDRIERRLQIRLQMLYYKIDAEQ